MRFLKKIIKRIMITPIIWQTLGTMMRHHGVVVLMYHRVAAEKSPFSALPLEKFRQQMLWLKKNCHILHPEEFIEQAGNSLRKRPSVLITFDDGQRCVHDVIYPVLKELDIPATVFLATSCMDNGGLIWTDEVSWAISETKLDSISLPWNHDSELSLVTEQERNHAAGLCKRYLKSLPDPDRQHWQSLLLKNLDSGDPAEKLEREMLNWDEVRACRDTLEFGGHTHNHPIMSQLDHDSLEYEISTCRNRIIQELGVPPTSFAYPNGEARDYNQDCKTILSKYGFSTAFTTIEGINTATTDSLELKRIPTGAEGVEDLAWMILRA